MEMPNVKLVIEYDGTHFHGWQKQPKLRTVQGLLEGVLTGVLESRKSVEVAGAGRTDAGVHAWGQVASFNAPLPMPVEKLPRVLNTFLPADIAVRSAEVVPDSFHATRSAKSRTYRYVFRSGGPPSPLRRLYSWHHTRSLNVMRVIEAAPLLVGTYDFSAFRDVGSEAKSNTKTVYRSEVREMGHSEIRYEIEADSFLYNMVRIIAGTLAEIGTGKRAPDDLVRALQTKKRAAAGPTAPPEGLFLVSVNYDEPGEIRDPHVPPA